MSVVTPHLRNILDVDFQGRQNRMRAGDPESGDTPPSLQHQTRMNPLDPKSFNDVYATIDNIEYHYIDQSPKKSTSKPAIVLVHGFPDVSPGQLLSR
jgi:hypothetical protein